MCIDGAVARFVFDYRLPPNAVSFLYGMRSKADAKSFMVCVHDVALKRDDEIWAADQNTFIANDGSDSIHGLPPEFYQYKGIKLFGRNLASIHEHPFRLLIYDKP